MSFTLSDSDFDPCFNAMERKVLRRILDRLAVTVPSTLNDLSDVDAAAADLDDTIVYDGTFWQAAPASGGGASGWKNIQDVAGVTINYAGEESGYGGTPEVFSKFYATSGYPSLTDSQTGPDGRIVLAGLPENNAGEGTVRVTILEATNDSSYDIHVGRGTRSGAGSITPASYVYTYANNTVDIPFRSGAPGNQSSWKALVLLEVYA